MANNLWTAPAGPLMPGASVAQSTFTAAQGIPTGETASAAYMVPGNTLSPGSMIDIEAWGVASNTGTPTIILGVYWGGVASGGAVGGTVIHALPSAVTTTTAMTSWTWHLTMQARLISVGTSGSIIAHGYWRWPTSLTAWTERIIPETAPAGVTIDTTTNKNVVLGATWSASSASNSITCHQMRVVVHG